MKTGFQNIFPQKKSLIGMIHVQALPGTPGNKMSVQEIIDKALRETETYSAFDFDGLIVENMHDIPYINGSPGPEITAAMSVITAAVKKKFVKPVGVQILAGANKQALAAAHAAGADFIRAEAYVFGHIADEGYMNAQAGELLRYRRYIGAEQIAVFADVKKKHASHRITSDITLAETVQAAGFFNADAVIVTGKHTGSSVPVSDLENLTGQELPVITGSGLTPENLVKLYPLADAFIVGSYIKKEGYWKNDLDTDRLEKLLNVWRELQRKTN